MGSPAVAWRVAFSVDVCPSDCLNLVGLSQIATDPRLAALAKAQLGLDPEQLQAFEPGELDAFGGAMLKDETACGARTDCYWVAAVTDSETGKEKRRAYCRLKRTTQKKK